MLPEFFGRQTSDRDEYGRYDIEILAEINHAPRLSRDEILALARHYSASGADLIDVGCEPGEPWTGVGDCVKMLRDEGYRVSIDSLQPVEISSAVDAGAELVLSVNGTNREAALDWGCEVVVVPDDFATLGGLEETVEVLATAGVPLRIDPVLEPIGFGFAASLARYHEVRRRYRDAEVMMGIGNLTELTDVDSAGVNVLLLAICQELGIRSVLTTEVIPWARSSVKECDIARRLVHYAIANRRLPKHVETGCSRCVTRNCVSAAATCWSNSPTRSKTTTFASSPKGARCTSSVPDCTCATTIRFDCSSSCWPLRRRTSIGRTRSTWASSCVRRPPH